MLFCSQFLIVISKYIKCGSMVYLSTFVGEENDFEDLSDLTLGGIVCGNPSKALRTRLRTRQESPTSQEHHEKLFARVSVTIFISCQWRIQNFPDEGGGAPTPKVGRGWG